MLFFTENWESSLQIGNFHKILVFSFIQDIRAKIGTQCSMMLLLFLSFFCLLPRVLCLLVRLACLYYSQLCTALPNYFSYVRVPKASPWYAFCIEGSKAVSWSGRQAGRIPCRLPLAGRLPLPLHAAVKAGTQEFESIYEKTKKQTPQQQDFCMELRQQHHCKHLQGIFVV